MSIEQKVGQLMIWTFSGSEFGPQIEDTLVKYQLGALIAFSRNIPSSVQIAQFNAQAQAFAHKHLKAPLMLMVDQEGGTVTRVRVNTPIPSALALGRMQNPAFAEDYAKMNAELLATLGFNVNLSPVLDVSDPNIDTFMANRVFGDDPHLVMETGLATAKGISESGVLPVGKHFPGHGGHVKDSHKGTPTKTATLEELEERDLIPFRNFIAADFPRAIMMAHLSLPKIDATGVPATYSRKVIQDILRGKYGYDGLVITDDLEMSGASISPNLGERAVRAFLAGNDMLMLAGHPRNQKIAFEAMVKAVKTGRIPLSRLDESVARILDVKDKIKPMNFKFERKKILDVKTKIEAMSREVMEHNFKQSTDGQTTRLPQINPNTKVTVFSSDPRFLRMFKQKFAGHGRLMRLTSKNLGKVSEEIQNTGTQFAIFYASGTVTARWVQKLNEQLKVKTLVVNCNNPGKISRQTDFISVLNINSPSPESGGWLAEILNKPPKLRAPAME
jgi:beta-N-acetylhexosaminidase